MGLLDIPERYKGLVGETEQLETKPRGVRNLLKKFMRFYIIREIEYAYMQHLEHRVGLYKAETLPGAPLLYYQNVSSSINDDIYAKELRAISAQFEQYKESLEKHFGPKEIYDLRNRFEERARLWHQFRAEGFDFSMENINRLKSLETTFRGRVELELLIYDKNHGIAPEPENDKRQMYLEKLIVQVEQAPIYYESGDFPNPLDNSDKEKDKAFQQIEQKHKETLEHIDKTLGTILENMYARLLNKNYFYTDKKAINKIEKVTRDLKLRAKLWKKAVSTIVCKETGTYNTERFYRENYDVLEKLERAYAKYNEGKGLKALEEVRERLGWEERQPLNAWVTNRTVREKDSLDCKKEVREKGTFKELA